MTRDVEDILRDEMFDSRDIIERLEELELDADDEASEDGCTHCNEGVMAHGEFLGLCDEHGDELTFLRAIVAECDGADDWEYGETFIREDYFTEYAQQLADDIGAIDADASWPNTYIDWERATSALKMDYTAYTIGGDTYYAR